MPLNHKQILVWCWHMYNTETQKPIVGALLVQIIPTISYIMLLVISQALIPPELIIPDSQSWFFNHWLALSNAIYKIKMI